MKTIQPTASSLIALFNQVNLDSTPDEVVPICKYSLEYYLEQMNNLSIPEPARLEFIDCIKQRAIYSLAPDFPDIEAISADSFRAWVRALCKEGLMFHFEDSPEDVISFESEDNLFSETECAELTYILQKAFDVLGSEVIFEISLEEIDWAVQSANIPTAEPEEALLTRLLA